jgi:glutamine synthetase
MSNPTASAASLIQLLVTDLVGITRGRSMASDDSGTWQVQGVGWVPANMALDPFGAYVTPNPWGATGDLRLKPEMATEVTIPDLPGGRPQLRFVLTDVQELDGSPWSCCPREFLRKSFTELSEVGLRLVATFEHEFTLTDGKVPSAPAFSLRAHRRREPFLSALYGALRVASVEPETLRPEYGPHQIGVTATAVRGLAVADRAVVTREVTREMAEIFGHAATFSPRPRPDAVGNGVRIHFSLRDAANQPATYDAALPGRLSEVAGAFAAGIVRHMPALCAITAPSPVSYLRLAAPPWGCGFACLGDGNREASLRLWNAPSSFGDASRGINLEYRPTDATANPYLALGVLIRAGVAGIRDKLPTPALIKGDPAALSDQERASLGVTRLPESLAAALNALGNDTIVRGWFPPPLLQTMRIVKAHEAALAASLSAEDLCERYAAVY